MKPCNICINIFCLRRLSYLWCTQLFTESTKKHHGHAQLVVDLYFITEHFVLLLKERLGLVSHSHVTLKVHVRTKIVQVTEKTNPSVAILNLFHVPTFHVPHSGDGDSGSTSSLDLQLPHLPLVTRPLDSLFSGGFFLSIFIVLKYNQ